MNVTQTHVPTEVHLDFLGRTVQIQWDYHAILMFVIWVVLVPGAHYTEERAALEEIARNTFAALRNGTLRVAVRHRYPLAAAAEAHRDLEARRTVGPIVLLP